MDRPPDRRHRDWLPQFLLGALAHRAHDRRDQVFHREKPAEDIRAAEGGSLGVTSPAPITATAEFEVPKSKPIASSGIARASFTTSPSPRAPSHGAARGPTTLPHPVPRDNGLAKDLTPRPLPCLGVGRG